MERNVLPSARRMKELKAAHDSVVMPDLAMIETAARPISAPELLSSSELLSGPEKMELEE
jgi:hypothetical protein